MLTDQMPVEHVQQIPDQEQKKILKEHFTTAYEMFAKSKLVAESAFEEVHGVQRCLSGIPFPFQNAVFGFPLQEDKWDDCIEAQLKYFHKHKLPFVWYVDDEASPAFEEQLKKHGFQDAGVLRGVLGFLDKPITPVELPSEYKIEVVSDDALLQDFNDLVSPTFAISGKSQEMYLKLLRYGMDQDESSPKLFHYLIRKDGKVVSAVSTLIEGELVSFWNGASLPEVRKQGLSTALRRFALQDAIQRGCKIGMSFLMAEGLAFGICSKLGYETKWRFRAWIAPPAASPTES